MTDVIGNQRAAARVNPSPPPHRPYHQVVAITRSGSPARLLARAAETASARHLTRAAVRR